MNEHSSGEPKVSVVDPVAVKWHQCDGCGAAVTHLYGGSVSSRQKLKWFCRECYWKWRAELN